jgi:hypothetical protein
MKKIIMLCSIALSMLILIQGGYAQDLQQKEKAEKNFKKEEKKQQKQAAQLADFNEAKAMAEAKRFVFKGSELFTSEGSAPLTGRTNFFYVIGDEATLQFAFEALQSIPNPNGLGGITSQGKVVNYNYKADNPKKPVQIEVTVQPLAGQGSGVHQLVLTIYGEGYAELLLQGSGTRVKGSVVKPENSKIYEGTQR